MRETPSSLFSKHPLCEILQNTKINMIRGTENITDELLIIDIDEFAEDLIARATIEKIILHEESAYIVNKEEIRKDGHERPTLQSASMLTGEIKITISIPFEGHKNYLNAKPQSRLPTPPIGYVLDNELRLQYITRGDNPNNISAENVNRIEIIKEYIGVINQEIETHNNWIKANTMAQVLERKKLVKDLSGFVKEIGIPLQRTKNLPEVYNIPLKRKKIRVSKPKISAEKYFPEPAIELTEYENILKMLSDMSLALEHNPKIFSNLDENAIRDFFLIILNSHYEGRATGETFNRGGKTDILIKENGKNVFIAEIKFWKGPKSLTKGIDQLLTYANWRDTKTAILLLNKNVNFSTVINKIDTTVKKHTHFYKENSQIKKIENETTFYYTFKQPTDIYREMFVSILAFDIPKK